MRDNAASARQPQVPCVKADGSRRDGWGGGARVLRAVRNALAAQVRQGPDGHPGVVSETGDGHCPGGSAPDHAARSGREYAPACMPPATLGVRTSYGMHAGPHGCMAPCNVLRTAVGFGAGTARWAQPPDGSTATAAWADRLWPPPPPSRRRAASRQPGGASARLNRIGVGAGGRHRMACGLSSVRRQKLAQLAHAGVAKRSTFETVLNEVSSRSHTVFTLTVVQTDNRAVSPPQPTPTPHPPQRHARAHAHVRSVLRPHTDGSLAWGPTACAQRRAVSAMTGPRGTSGAPSIDHRRQLFGGLRAAGARVHGWVGDRRGAGRRRPSRAC
jgi:hypothetical protein